MVVGPQAIRWVEDTKISAFLRKVQIETQLAPLLEAGVAEFRQNTWTYRCAASLPTPEPRIFDLASVTKPFFAMLVSSLVDGGSLTWQTHLQEVLPEVRGTFAGSQTIEALLSHRSGLMPHIELFRPSWWGLPIRTAKLLRQAAESSQEKSSAKVGRRYEPVYSDLGYILLGFAVERITGQPLDEALGARLLNPFSLEVGSARSFRAHTQGKLDRFVPTELQMPRGGQLLGVVHDDNAWALRGTGMCGHAGLFGTVPGILRFGTTILDTLAGRERTLSSVVAPLVQTRPGGTLRMGFDGVKNPGSMAGEQATGETFGHLGFTGTSLFCDPGRQRVVVLLSNRVCPSRDNPRIRTIRPKIHDFLWLC
jgi:serine-type D-Ala-D-Ala carboxypeptidase